MQKEVGAEKREKTSFIKKHAVTLLIAILAASSGAVVTVTVTKYLTKSPNRELLIANEDSVSLINGDLPTQITSNYFLTDKPTKKIKSLFLKKIGIKNNGNVDAEDIPLFICVKGKDIFLIDKPTIKTEPKKIIDVINIRKKTDSTSNKHTWNIPLLKPGEDVIFEYMIYSEKKVKNVEVNVVTRKKGWEDKKGIISNPNTKKTSWLDVVVTFLGTLTFGIGLAGLGGGLVYKILILVEKIVKTHKETDQNIDEEITN